ncbi:hypothetical protein K7I13_05490 [Brucepastera parasyntrophica]|uniref:hypothetical protein n=1 Tax=Brucepastera parasyntrophica TaxID=2880008 RepID=UPI00210B9A1E|nr:hypothetical protein [Brucepastera parasyntrophica]ULQ60724.1 hypothetical protein K7I13_05490 [Brucepastera parasyntrophica]
MKLKDFIYYYSKIYLTELINEVHIAENWADRDFDVKYARYLQEFINTSHVLKKFEEKIKRNLTDDECIKILISLKKMRMEELYDYLSEVFLKK